MDTGGAAVAGWEWEWWQLLFTIVVLLVVRIALLWNRLECYPGPPGLPLVGHFHLLLGATGRLDDIFDFFGEIMAANNGVRDIRALYHPKHAVYCALLGYQADWMLIRACDPML